MDREVALVYALINYSRIYRATYIQPHIYRALYIGPLFIYPYIGASCIGLGTSLSGLGELARAADKTCLSYFVVKTRAASLVGEITLLLRGLETFTL